MDWDRADNVLFTSSTGLVAYLEQIMSEKTTNVVAVCHVLKQYCEAFLQTINHCFPNLCFKSGCLLNAV